MKIAIIGATGLVGKEILQVLQESRVFHEIEIFPVASSKSYGKEIFFKEKPYYINSFTECIDANPDIAIFSAGAETSLQWAEKFTENNVFVIDNSSAWRMKDGIPLIVPEINGSILSKKTYLIANPNCSTIQMVVALAPLHKKYKIRRVVVSTYQSVSGSGYKAIEQLDSERKGEKAEMVYPHPIDLNVLPHGGNFNDKGYTSEELKLLNETRKILADDSVQITSTVVRVPIKVGHSEAINVEFENDYDLDEVRNILENTEGIIVNDDPVNHKYPMPVYCEGKDEVFVGRLRRDFSNPNSLNMWVVADNLRKGAATNTVQIAEYLVKNRLV